MAQITLAAAVSGHVELTDGDIEQIVNLLCVRCRVQTRHRVRKALQDVTGLDGLGIYGRVIKRGDSWRYCTAQSFNDEVRYIRQQLIAAGCA